MALLVICALSDAYKLLEPWAPASGDKTSAELSLTPVVREEVTFTTAYNSVCATRMVVGLAFFTT